MTTSARTPFYPKAHCSDGTRMKNSEECHVLKLTYRAQQQRTAGLSKKPWPNDW